MSLTDNSKLRKLRAPDLNLHPEETERMISTESLLRYQFAPEQRPLTGPTARAQLTALD